MRLFSTNGVFSLTLAFALTFVTRGVGSAATQVGSAPYRASATGAGNSHSPVFSADGRHVAFVSQANNLVTNDDLAPHLDLFVRDLMTSNTVLVSVSTNGVGGANDNIGLYTLSSNAQVIAFDTTANNLATGDNNHVSDIYARDLAAGTTKLVSVSADGTSSGNGPSSNPLISEDGRYVVFESLASNLVTNDFNGTNDIFICDLATGITTLVSVNADGTASPDGPSHSPSISADGLFVAFASRATNLVSGVTNRQGEIYLREVAVRSNRWAAASHLDSTREGYPNAIGGAYRASEPLLSADGRYVVFKTATRTVRFDFETPTNSTFELFAPSSATESGYAFRYDANPRVSTPAGATPMVFSRNGRFLAYGTRTNLSFPSVIIQVDFESLNDVVVFLPPIGTLGGGIYETNRAPSTEAVATNLPAGVIQATWLGQSESATRIFFLTDATNLSSTVPKTSKLYMRALPDGPIQLINTTLSGESSPHWDGVIPAISLDGSLLAWDSPDDNIVADDLNRAWDVFVRNVDTGETQLVSAAHPALSPATGGAMSKMAGNQSISDDGSRIVVVTRDSNLSSDDTNKLADAVFRDLGANTNLAVTGPFPIRVAPGFLTQYLPTNEVFSSKMSLDGRYLLFSRYWRDLAVGTNDFIDLYDSSHTNAALSQSGLMVAYGRRFDFGSAALSSPGQFVSDNNNVPDVFLRDYRTSQWTLRLMSVSTRSDNTPGASSLYAANAPSINPAFSPDSRWIVFQSLATDLTYDADNITEYQLYAREIDTPFIKRISYFGSVQTNALPLAGGATNPVFSADARFVFFEGGTSNLIYRHDLLNDMDDTGTARRPNLVVCAGCANPSASSEGRLVAYESRSGPGGSTNIFVKDITSGQVELISVSMTGTNGNGPSFTPLLSHDARFVVFGSKASDLVPGDNNRATDIFVRDRLNGVTHCLSRNFAGTGTGNRVSSNPIMSADGRHVAFQSFASDLVPGDYNDTRDVFVVTLGGPDTDGDRMDDDWEMAYFSTLDRDGSGDFDNDGASDLAEFRAGTIPSNDASILRVLTISTVHRSPSELSQAKLVWSAVPGRTYRVQFKDNVAATAWMDVPGDVVATTTSASKTYTPSYYTGFFTNRRFYRVLMVQ